MQTSTEVRRLRQVYDYETQPLLPVVASLVGLCVVTVVSIVGSRVSAGDVMIAERLDGERGRLAVAQAAMEHSREVFAGRRDNRNARLIHATYAQAAPAMP